MVATCRAVGTSEAVTKPTAALLLQLLLTHNLACLKVEEKTVILGQ